LATHLDPDTSDNPGD